MELKEIIIKIGRNHLARELIGDINMWGKLADEAVSENYRQYCLGKMSNSADILLKYARLWELDLSIEKATQDGTAEELAELYKERDAILQGESA